MKIHYVLLLPTALLLIQVGRAIASVQPHATTLTPAPLLAQSPAPAPSSTEPPQPNDTPTPPWARDLNLTKEQKVQLQTVDEQARKEGEALHQKLVAAEEKLRSLLQSTASIQTLRQQHEEVQKLRQQLDNNRFEALLGERQVLTPEQLAKVIQQFRRTPTTR